MQKTGFSDALEKVLEADSRYDREAYLFLQEALGFTAKPDRKQREEKPRHVSGQELLAGIRKYALKEFGPMAISVFSYWGIHRCEDFGEMVYNLIREKAFDKTETDSIEDFRSGYDFVEAFVTPFKPSRNPIRVGPGGTAKKPAVRKNTERNADGEVRK